MTTINDICNGFNNIVNESEEIRTILCADIALASKYIKQSTFQPCKTFGEPISKIFNILIKYYSNEQFKKKIHPYLKQTDKKEELINLSKRTDPQALSIILKRVPKYRNILTLFDLYSIIRIINEFNIEYSSDIKTAYYEERLKLCENNKCK